MENRKENNDMGKYRIYKNKRTNYHPAIQISILEDGTWENIEITDSPTKTGSYEKLDVNPNPNSTKQSYFRKYLRKDKIRHRGAEFKKYSLVVSDEIKIDVYVSLIKEKRKNGGKPTNEALTQKGRTPSNEIKSANKHKSNKKDSPDQQRISPANHTLVKTKAIKEIKVKGDE